MENAALCLIIIVFFLSGYFVMDRLGRFMEEVYRARSGRMDAKKPAAGTVDKSAAGTAEGTAEKSRGSRSR